MKGRWIVSAMVAALAAMVLSGCGEPVDTELMADARRSIESGDSAAAMIELKNVLERKPQAGEARYLLARLMFVGGDPVGAEDQVRQALQYGYPEEEGIPLLAAILASMNRSKALLEQFADLEFPRDPAATADLKIHVSAAHAFNGDYGKAESSIARALELAPDHADATAARARLRAIRGHPDAARTEVEELLTRMPKNAAAWALKGDLLLFADDRQVDRGLEAHRTALNLRPTLVQSHAAIITTLIGRGDVAAASDQWGKLKQALPSHPQTDFFEAVLALRKGKPAVAQQIAHRMLVAAPNDLRLLLVGGQAELEMGSLEQAEALLSKAFKIAHRASAPRHLLAEVYLRTGRAENALAVLEPLLTASTGDAIALSLAGRAQLVSGDAAAADASFARAKAMKPDDRRIQMSAAMAQLSSGRAEAALAQMESIAVADLTGSADLALISVRLQRKEYDAALRAVEALAAKQPKDALPDHLRGRIALARNDTAASRRYFEASVAKNPRYFPAVANLVALDVAAGNAAAARARLEEVRRREPSNAQARLALAKLMIRAGDAADDVGKVIEEAVKAAPADPGARVALIDHHLATGNRERALAVAQDAVATLPDNLELADKLGGVHMALGDVQQAQMTYTRMNSTWPQAALPHIRMAEAYLASARFDAAQDSIRLALKVAPRSVQAHKVAAVVAIRQNRPEQALTLARGLQAQNPKDPAGIVLEGDLAMTIRKFDAAAAAYRKALAMRPNGEMAKQLYLALSSAGQLAEANRWADTWLKQHHNDTAFLSHVAAVAIGRGDLVHAESRFREVLQREPNNAQAMNNVAYTMIKLKRPGALQLAERAAELAPDNPAVLDTLAAAHAEQGNLRKAIQWQVKAVELAPQVASYRLNLARLHIKANDRDLAVEELDRLAKLGKAFSGYSEVAQLRKKLGP